MKKLLLLVVAAGLVAVVGAQQMTRVAVVDLIRIYDAYSKDAAPLKAFEEFKTKVQSDANKLQAEINDLQKKKADAIAASNQEVVAQIDKEIAVKMANFKSFLKIKTNELDERKKKLLENVDFAKASYAAIQGVAESEGYAIVLTTTHTDSVVSDIVWYSPLIDITDKVIQAIVK